MRTQETRTYGKVNTDVLKKEIEGALHGHYRLLIYAVKTNGNNWELRTLSHHGTTYHMDENILDLLDINVNVNDWPVETDELDAEIEEWAETVARHFWTIDETPFEKLSGVSIMEIFD